MLNKDVNYKLVDTAGQITAVVSDVLKRNRYASISNYLMRLDNKIEQVVFIEKNRIQTMGNELCINGSLAGAYLLRRPKIEISGIDRSVEFVQKNKSISIQLPLSLFQIKNKNIIKETDSLVWENACGSGSLSYFIYSGRNKIIQPSNKIIEIRKSEKYFFIKVRVKIVNKW